MITAWCRASKMPEENLMKNYDIPEYLVYGKLELDQETSKEGAEMLIAELDKMILAIRKFYS